MGSFLSSYSSLLCVAGRYPKLLFLDPVTLTKIHEIRTPKKSNHTVVAYSSSSSSSGRTDWLAVGENIGDSSRVLLYHLGGKGIVRATISHSHDHGSVRALDVCGPFQSETFSTTRPVIVSADWGGTAKVSDAQSGHCLLTLATNLVEPRVVKCCFGSPWSGDGQALVAGGTYEWNYSSRRFIARMAEDSSATTSSSTAEESSADLITRFMQARNTPATADDDEPNETCAIHRFDVRRGGDPIQKYFGHGTAVQGIDLMSSDCQSHGHFCSVASDKSLRVWDVNQGGAGAGAAIYVGLHYTGSSVCCIPETPLVVCGESNGWTETFDVRSVSEPVLREQVHQETISYHSENPTEVWSIVFVGEKEVVSVAEDKNVLRWNCETGKRSGGTMHDEGHCASHYGAFLLRS